MENNPPQVNSEEAGVSAVSDVQVLAKNDQTPPTDVQTPTVVRDNLISTAVKFLQNPKVRERPLAQKIEFLERKGMTKTEIDLAILRSGTPNDASANPSVDPSQNVVAPPAYIPGPPMYPLPVPSTWSRVVDAANVVVLLSGAAYAIYQFYKKFVVPALYGPKQVEASLSDVNRSIDELRQSLTDVVATLTETQTLIKSQQRQLDDVIRVHTLQRGPEEIDRMNVSEIRDELKSLKALLLNRKQFPALPTTTPVIPAWQLQQNAAAAAAVGKPGVTSTEADGAAVIADGSESATVVSAEIPAINVDSVENSDNVTATEPVLDGQKSTSEQTTELLQNGHATDGAAENVTNRFHDPSSDDNSMTDMTTAVPSS